jgi:hypothetical protein
LWQHDAMQPVRWCAAVGTGLRTDVRADHWGAVR